MSESKINDNSYANHKSSRKKSSEETLYDIENQIDDVKNLASKNIEKVIQRAENLDSLTHKARELESDSLVFHSGSRGLRRSIQCQYYKRNALIAFIVVVILSLIIWRISK